MNRKYLTGYKLFFGLLGLSAIVTEIAVIVERGNFNPANFFSYFTIESNILAVVALLASAFFVFAGKKSPWLDYFRGAVTFFMIVTGIVFAVLLAGLENAQLTAVPWDNTVLHYLMPIAVAVDWLMDRPARRLSFRRGLTWLIFPVAYLVYSLLRGAATGWYPYPFLDPANGGYGKVLITSLIIMIGGIVLIYAVTRVGIIAKKSN